MAKYYLNNNFQNPDQQALMPDTDFNIYESPQFSGNAMAPMPAAYPESDYMNPDLYSADSALNNPNITPLPHQNSYAKGGKVKGGRTQNKSREEEEEDPNRHNYPILAEIIRQQGEGNDTRLVHINPLEEQILSLMSGGGSINPKTQLRQFGLFDKPGKWFKSIAGGAGGAILGNMLLPGIGGIIGGALGNAAGAAVRGKKKSLGKEALKGAGMGLMAPSLAGLFGSGASALGANTVGSYLTDYGNQNAVLPALARLIGSSGGSPASMPFIPPASPTTHNLPPQFTIGSAPLPPEKGFTDKLIGNSKEFLTQPANLLALAATAGSFLNRPKPPREKSPEEVADYQKRLNRSLMLSPDEMRAKEEHDLALEQAKRRIANDKFLPQERLGPIAPIYAKTNTPDEYKKRKRWIEYYDNPGFTGSPVTMKEGGMANADFVMEEMDYPSGVGSYISGNTKGQDDKIAAYLSDGEFVIPADIVSHIGDGNNNAGASMLSKMILNVRKHKTGNAKFPPKAKPLKNYLMASGK